MTKQLSIQEVEYVAHRLARKLMEWDEPIPEFSTRYPKVLESCIATPFVTFDSNYLYRGLKAKAAILFYLLIKDHPFQNGNKRIAVTALLIFLMKNKHWMKVGTREFYNFAAWVASSPSELKEDTVNAVTSFINQHLVVYYKKS